MCVKYLIPFTKFEDSCISDYLEERSWVIDTWYSAPDMLIFILYSMLVKSNTKIVILRPKFVIRNFQFSPKILLFQGESNYVKLDLKKQLFACISCTAILKLIV